MKHGIPEGKNQIVFLDFSQNLRGKDEQEDEDLQSVGHIDVQAALHKAGDEEQDQRQAAEEHVVIIAVKQL